VIAIIDYGMGNLRSVDKALEFLGHETCVTRDPKSIESADKVILPGVGAFGAAMDNLKRFDLIECVKDAAKSGKPFLGICLGMQVLLEQSAEYGIHQGLGIIPGNVVKFFKPEDITDKTRKLKIPNMGWCPINIKKPSPLFSNVPDQSMVYFVHSYYVDPLSDVIAATTHHGIDYCSAIWHKNIFATQFHPEKSGTIGLRMLKNFAEAENWN